MPSDNKPHRIIDIPCGFYSNDMIIYLLIINIIAATMFIYDKHQARNHGWRIPEKVLHLTELLGGVIAIIPLMYLIHHKNKKASYYLVTYLMLIIFVAAMWFLFNHLVEATLSSRNEINI